MSAEERETKIFAFLANLFIWLCLRDEESPSLCLSKRHYFRLIKRPFPAQIEMEQREKGRKGGREKRSKKGAARATLLRDRWVGGEISSFLGRHEPPPD